MEEPALRARVFIGEADAWQRRSLAHAIVLRARDAGLSGATIVKAVGGFGAHRRIHDADRIETEANLPEVVEVTDRAAAVAALVPVVGAMVREGLLVLEHVTVRHAASGAAGRPEGSGPAKDACRGREAQEASGEGTLVDGVPALCLRVYVGAKDMWRGEPVARAVVRAALDQGMAGATLWRGVEGFGVDRSVHAAHVLPIPEDLPMLVEIVDRADRVEAFLPVLERMLTSGLVTTSPATAIRYPGGTRAPAG